MPARRIIRPATHFQLTRVTRIFQKSAFTKVAPTSPGETPLRAFCCPAATTVALESSATFECRNRSPAVISLFWIVPNNEFCNLNVLAATGLAPGASCFLPPRRDELVDRTKRQSPASKGGAMSKMGGRSTSVNGQKVMGAVGELERPHERIDVGGAFGKNKEPAYLAMNPNGLVPTLEEEDGFLLWE